MRICVCVCDGWAGGGSRWGYTGTLGAEYVHYLVTDRASSPPDTRALYSERLLYLPRTTYLISDHAVTRREALAWRAARPYPAHPAAPPDGGAAAAAAGAVAAVRGVVGAGGRAGAVLCSFNQLYKLTPEVRAHGQGGCRRLRLAVLLGGSSRAGEGEGGCAAPASRTAAEAGAAGAGRVDAPAAIGEG